MKISELMEGINPNKAFSGFVMADNMVLAIDVSNKQNAEIGDYAVLQTGIEGVDPSLNSETSEKNYIRAGKSSTKTGTQRSFSVSGDIYSGDEAQDKLLSHDMKYAVGQAAIVNYVYFNMLTGIGEKGQATVAVNSDGGGNAGENATLDIELSKSGAAPAVFDYTTDSLSTRLSALSGITLNPTFDSSIFDYTATVTEASSTITATTKDKNATVTIKNGNTEIQNGTVTWNDGENNLTITVTNGSAQSVYTIKVTKTAAA